MDSVRMKGKTVEEAIESALTVLGAKRDDVDINIISEGKGGVLGVFGGEEAEVEVKLKKSLSEDIKTWIQGILDKAGLMTLVRAEESKDVVKIDIKGEDFGRIIGKRGAMLQSLQALASAFATKRAGKPISVIIDAGGYVEKRNKKLRRMAEEAIKKVERTGKEQALPPMSASERRIVHLIVKENKNVSSISRGEGEGRRVVIMPKSEKESEKSE